MRYFVTFSCEIVLSIPCLEKVSSSTIISYTALLWLAADVGGVADLYVEGIDQFGGWFLSSLLTSVALQGKPPYRYTL